MDKLIIFILFSIFLNKLGKKKEKEKAKKKEEKYKEISNPNLKKIERQANYKKTEKENIKKKKTEERRLIGVLNEVINALSPEDKEKAKKLIKSKNKPIKSETEKSPKIDIKTFKDSEISEFDYTLEGSYEGNSPIDVNLSKDYFGGDDLVKAIIMKEILDKPVSAREEA
ncbi:Hypothetical protein ING2D1G_0977 [Peptoniphilus sp. ING2-D1G]|nr:Hypothetical protein ING2D1G_0977 [Peptoniphilus sp. ING2-D1G]